MTVLLAIIGNQPTAYRGRSADSSAKGLSVTVANIVTGTEGMLWQGLCSALRN